MYKAKIKFLKTDEKAQLPKRNHGNIDHSAGFEINGTCDSGFDVFGIEEKVVPAHGSVVVPVGMKLAFIEPGYWFRVESRGGLSFKHGILAHPGIVDNQYRGDLGIKLYNHSDKDYTVQSGERIAQIVIYPIVDGTMEWSETVDQTQRGEKAFGSSGKL